MFTFVPNPVEYNERYPYFNAKRINAHRKVHSKKKSLTRSSLQCMYPESSWDLQKSKSLDAFSTSHNLINAISLYSLYENISAKSILRNFITSLESLTKFNTHNQNPEKLSQIPENKELDEESPSSSFNNKTESPLSLFCNHTDSFAMKGDVTESLLNEAAKCALNPILPEKKNSSFQNKCTSNSRRQFSLPCSEKLQMISSRAKKKRIMKFFRSSFSTSSNFDVVIENVSWDPATFQNNTIMVGSDDINANRKKYKAQNTLKRKETIRRRHTKQNSTGECIYDLAFIVTMSVETFQPDVLWMNPEKHDKVKEYFWFCFPEAKVNLSRLTSNEKLTYQFMRTLSDGSIEYGYCRKENFSKINQPIVLCLITNVDAFDFYDKILIHSCDLLRFDMEKATTVLTEMGRISFPKFGKPLILYVGNDNYLAYIMPEESGVYCDSLWILLQKLSLETIIKVLSALLLERSVIFFNKSLSILSRAINAFRSLLYPLQWQYNYVPVLPSSLIEFCEAPTQFIYGVHYDKLDEVVDKNLDEVLLVDLEKGQLYNEKGDESTIIPQSLQQSLIANLVKVLSWNNRLFMRMTNKLINVILGEAFMRVFVELFHKFPDYVYELEDKDSENGFFAFEKFLCAQPEEYKFFLRTFSQTAMFESLVVNVFTNQHRELSRFDKRVKEYRMNKSSLLFSGPFHKFKESIHNVAKAQRNQTKLIKVKS